MIPEPEISGGAGPGEGEPPEEVPNDSVEAPEPEFDDILDCCGYSCSQVIEKLQHKLEEMQRFTVLKLAVDDLDTRTLIPEWCENNYEQHKELLEKIAENTGLTTLYHYIMKM